MDVAADARIQDLIAAETSRRSVPDGFPKLPDLPVGRYLDVDLVRVSSERDFDPSVWENRDLVTVRCELLNGFVFVNFDPDAAPLREFAAPLFQVDADRAVVQLTCGSRHAARDRQTDRQDRRAYRRAGP